MSEEENEKHIRKSRLIYIKGQRESYKNKHRMRERDNMGKLV